MKRLGIVAMVTLLVVGCREGSSPTDPRGGGTSGISNISAIFEMESSSCESKFESLSIVMQCQSSCVIENQIAGPQTLSSKAGSTTIFYGLTGGTWKYTATISNSTALPPYASGNLELGRNVSVIFGGCAP